MVFGDSLSAAYGITRESGWVHLLEQRLAEEKFDHPVVNASISGETTAGGRQRIEQSLVQHRPAVVILELGANDGLRGLPLAAMQDNLEAIIQACHRHNARVLLVGMRLPPNYGIAYAEKFQNTYFRLAKRHKLGAVPFLLEGFADRRDLFQADNLHPTAQAQPLILDNIWRPLRGLLRR
jgi:acyl-CoA thioesterase-1